MPQFIHKIEVVVTTDSPLLPEQFKKDFKVESHIVRGATRSFHRIDMRSMPESAVKQLIEIFFSKSRQRYNGFVQSISAVEIVIISDEAMDLLYTEFLDSITHLEKRFTFADWHTMSVFAKAIGRDEDAKRFVLRGV